MKSYANWILSALSAGLAAFLLYFSGGGTLDGPGIHAALAAAVAAAINHIRNSPFGGED